MQVQSHIELLGLSKGLKKQAHNSDAATPVVPISKSKTASVNGTTVNGTAKVNGTAIVNGAAVANADADAPQFAAAAMGRTHLVLR